MYTVVGVGGDHRAVPGSHRGVVVHVGDALLLGVGADRGVEPDDLLRRFDPRTPRIVARGVDRAEDRPDAVGAGQVDHRLDVVQNVLRRDVARIPGQVVRAAADHHDLRVQLDDVGAEAHEHLRGGLPADGAAHEAVAGEEVGMFADPPLGDRVAHQHGPRRGGLRGVLLLEAGEVGPVVGCLGGGRRRKAECGGQHAEFSFQ